MRDKLKRHLGKFLCAVVDKTSSGYALFNFDVPNNDVYFPLKSIDQPTAAKDFVEISNCKEAKKKNFLKIESFKPTLLKRYASAHH